jgi:hypothetical protein
MIGMRNAIPFLVLSLFFFSLRVSAQTKWNYISPMPGSKFINPENKIALRHGNVIKPGEFNNIKIQVSGSISNEVQGKFQISRDQKTLVFNPDYPSQPGELITVEVSNALCSGAADTTFSFWISNHPNLISRNIDHYSPIHTAFENSDEKPKGTKQLLQNPGYQLPDNLPPLQITMHNHPSSGYLFMNSSGSGDFVPYLQIVDNTGLPVYYKKFDHTVRDFKVISGQRLIYFEGHYSGPATNYYLVLDAAYRPLDTLRMENGYTVDNHDALLLDNGNRIMLSYDPQLVGMDTVVPGGDPMATVVGFVIQEIDQDNNVILQWRSWDHMEITDAVGIDFTASYVDYIHGNSVEVDNDGNLLISSRHLNEVTKIDRNTGEIIWRFGPNAKNNMFTFLNDSIGFSYQHDARRTNTGTITIYDNGNLHEPQFSQAIEYEVDETNLIAERIWHFDHNHLVYANATGSTRRLDDGNTFIGWGSVTPGSPIITEVDQEGNITLEAGFPDWVHSYRVIKEMWETTAFNFDADSLNFEPSQPGDTASKLVFITNNLDHEIEINNLIGRTEFFKPGGEFPVSIPAGEEREITVDFVNESIGLYNDVLTFCYDIENDTQVQRIAKQIPVTAEVSEDAAIPDVKKNSFRVFPNPATDELIIQSFGIVEYQAKLYTLQGTIVYQISSDENDFKMSLSDLSEGIYILKIISPDSKTSAKKIIKN